MGKKADNAFIDWVCDEIDLSKQQRRLLHLDITGQRLTKKEILERAQEIKELYPRK
jgi:hypothetical protein